MGREDYDTIRYCLPCVQSPYVQRKEAAANSVLKNVLEFISMDILKRYQNHN